jgi:Fe-S-cluster containining protein
MNDQLEYTPPKGFYEKLAKLWDGKASNVSEVCVNCGACCHVSEKPLMSGEYDYIAGNYGVHNSLWISKACLCNKVGYKPVICKTYPLIINADFSGYFVVEQFADGYTSKCQELYYDNIAAMRKYLDFLFSDPVIRLQWGIMYYHSYLVHAYTEIIQEAHPSHDMDGIHDSCTNLILGIVSADDTLPILTNHKTCKQQADEAKKAGTHWFYK